MKLLSFLLVVLSVFFYGCSINSQTQYIQYQPSQSVVSPVATVNSQQVTYNGYIKGVIEKVIYDNQKHLWVYSVKAEDTTNGKLSYAKFFYKEKIANEGEEIYAKVISSILKEYFLSAKPLSKKIEKKQVIQQKNIKNKKIPNIGIPQSEEILLD